jgi:hypothetical protein
MPSIKATLINSNPDNISVEDWASICEELFWIVVDSSPVDTGYFKDAWELNQISDDIWEIFNPTEYASFLEEGWSDQAPNGMLQPAMDELSSIISSYTGKRTGYVYATLEVPEYVPG